MSASIVVTSKFKNSCFSCFMTHVLTIAMTTDKALASELSQDTVGCSINIVSHKKNELSETKCVPGEGSRGAGFTDYTTRLGGTLVFNFVVFCINLNYNQGTPDGYKQKATVAFRFGKEFGNECF